MGRVADFCDAVGLTEAVRKWLRSNAGDALREQIIAALTAAVSDNLAPQHRAILRGLISKIPDMYHLKD